MKKVFSCIFTVLILLLLCLSGCGRDITQPTATPPYASKVPQEKTEEFVMSIIGDDVYINFKDGNVYDHLEFVQIATISFESLSDMRKTIKENRFTESQAAIIKTSRSFKKDENGIKICNPDKLYQPVLPDHLKTEGVICAGETYSIIINGDGKFSPGYAHFFTKESFDASWEKNKDYSLYTDMAIKKDEKVGDIPATAYYFSTSSCDIRQVVYFTEVNGKKLRIIEEYILRADADSDLRVSAVLPDVIRIYGEEKGQYYEIYLAQLNFKPTVDWLLQFGIEEYKDTENN